MKAISVQDIDTLTRKNPTSCRHIRLLYKLRPHDQHNAEHDLQCFHSSIAARSICVRNTLLIAWLPVRARRFRCSASATFYNVGLVNGVLLVFFCMNISSRT